MTETLAVPATRGRRGAVARGHPPLEAGARRVAVLALLGLAVRIWIMTGRLGAIDSDEAMTGLMARHVLDGEHRAFMWRLSYQGTIVTYPVAASFWLLGTSRVALELPFLLMSAGRVGDDLAHRTAFPEPVPGGSSRRWRSGCGPRSTCGSA